MEDSIYVLCYKEDSLKDNSQIEEYKIYNDTFQDCLNFIERNNIKDFKIIIYNYHHTLKSKK